MNFAYELRQGDVLERLLEMPDESMNCVVTSPPYWGLRDYGVDGQIGLEPTPAEFIAKMVAVFAEVRRVLRSDGTCWINMGDGYAGSWGAQGRDGEMASRSVTHARTIAAHPHKVSHTGSIPKGSNLKPKDLIGMPWRLAFALQEDGWWLRQDIIWSKPNPMPESVTDRCTKAHEYLFLLTKSARYHYDQEAIIEPCTSGPSDIRKMEQKLERIGGKHKILVDTLSKASSTTNIGQKRSVGNPDGRNKRSVWEIATEPNPEAHFATFPRKLVEPCIRAGCPEGGTVLDPFNGSGTTGLVALANRCNYIGIELNPEYVAMSERRLSAATAQEVMAFAE